MLSRKFRTHPNLVKCIKDTKSACVINLEALIFHTPLISEDHLPAYEDTVHNYALNGELRL